MNTPNVNRFHTTPIALSEGLTPSYIVAEINVPIERVTHIRENFHVLAMRDSGVPMDVKMIVVTNNFEDIRELFCRSAFISDRPENAIPMRLFKVFKLDEWQNHVDGWYSTQYSEYHAPA